MDPSKIEGVVKWPIPSNVKAIRGFLGLTGYYRKFIKDYGVKARPLTNLLKKNAFQWNAEAHTAFEDLKTAITTGPVLALPDFTILFFIECDASRKGMGLF